jgi:hypothetical protein
MWIRILHGTLSTLPIQSGSYDVLPSAVQSLMYWAEVHVSSMGSTSDNPCHFPSPQKNHKVIESGFSDFKVTVSSNSVLTVDF